MAALNQFVGDGSRFNDSIMHEAAQRFRDECNRLSASQSIYLGGTLVFAMLFAAAYLLQAEQLFAGYPDWQLGLLLGFLWLAAMFAAYKIINTFRAARRVRLLRDASLAIGHQLQQLSSASTLLFHDVKTSAGVIDHVVISREGIYAVNVIARRSSAGASARVHTGKPRAFFRLGRADLRRSRSCEKHAARKAFHKTYRSARTRALSHSRARVGNPGASR